MTLLICFVIFMQAIFGSIISPPRDLEVNYKQTHEEYDILQRRHLPIVQVFKSDLTIKLPLFSWKLYNDDEDCNLYNISQKHYEIELYHEYEESTHKQLIWKSDKILSNEHFCNLNNINKKTNDLKNILKEFKWQILSYRVRSTYDENSITKWSKLGRFIITSSVKADWNNASYIAQNKTNDASPMFMKTFSLSSGKTVSSAVISIVGLGFFKLYVNDNDILNLQQPPIYQIGGWTNTKYRVPYATFSVASYLSSASTNEMVVYLGVGYRNQTAYPPQDSNDGKRSQNDSIDCILKLQLIIKYTDNTEDVIITDNSWKTASTKIRYSSIYNGEIYDENGNTDNMQNVMIVTGPEGILSPTMQPYVSINKIINPLDTIYPFPAHNSQIVDFGENNGGVVAINVGGLGLKKGDAIHMKFAEIKQHPPYGPMNGALYYGNLRTAEQYDTFISDGNSTGFYTPFFTMHGFRYMEVWGYPRTLKVEDIDKLQIYSAVTQRSNWTSSDQVLNIVNQRCLNAQRSNLKSVPTDCNQRDERLGWMGDAALSSNTFAINFDMKSFFVNYLELMADEQDSTGSLPDVVPFYRYGARPSDPNWGIAFPQFINVLYQYYGTMMIDIVKQYMDGPTYNLPNYIKNLQSRMPKHRDGEDNISRYPAAYGDWVPPPPVPKINNHFSGAFGYIETVKIIKNLADIIGNTSYESYLNTLESTLINEFIAAFYNYANNEFVHGLQTSFAMTLHSEIYSNDTMKNTLETNLIQRIKTDDNLLTTGIIGAKFILPVLHAINETNLSINLIKGNKGINNQQNASYPSWVFEQENHMEPATAVWEMWDDSVQKNSRNHHMFSSVSAYLNTHISGIKNKENLYNHWEITIGHLLYDELKWSNFEIDRGLIKFNWKWQTEKQLNVNITIPFGHFGDLHFKINDKKKQCKIIENDNKNKHKEWKLINNFFIDTYNATINNNGIIMIGSGHYKWSIFCK